jgi:hypothetical protein
MRWFVCLTALVMLMAAASGDLGYAQEGAANGCKEGEVPGKIGEEDTCPTTFGPLIADTAVPLEHGKFAIQPYTMFRFTGGLFTPGWRRVKAPGNYFAFELPVKFTYGLFKHFEIYAVATYRHNWVSNLSPDFRGPRGEKNADYGGIRDINLTLKYLFLEETASLPAVAGIFGTDFPTGHYYHLNPGRLGVDQVGYGCYTFYTGLNASKYVKPFIFYANLWYGVSTRSQYRFEAEDLGTVNNSLHYRDVLYLRLAAEYPLGGRGPWVALLEYYAEFETGRIFGPKPNSPIPAYAYMGICPGIEYVYSDRLAFALGVAIDLAGKSTAFEYTPMLSMIHNF